MPAGSIGLVEYWSAFGVGLFVSEARGHGFSRSETALRFGYVGYLGFFESGSWVIGLNLAGLGFALYLRRRLRLRGIAAWPLQWKPRAGSGEPGPGAH